MIQIIPTLIASGGYGYAISINLLFGLPIFAFYGAIVYSLLKHNKFKSSGLLALHSMALIPITLFFVFISINEAKVTLLNPIFAIFYSISSGFMYIKPMLQNDKSKNV